MAVPQTSKYETNMNQCPTMFCAIQTCLRPIVVNLLSKNTTMYLKGPFIGIILNLTNTDGVHGGTVNDFENYLTDDY